MLPVSRSQLTPRKLAQVSRTMSSCNFNSPDRLVDALKAIQALRRVQRAWDVEKSAFRFPDSRAKVAILLTNQVQCKQKFNFWICAMPNFAIADPGATMTFVAGGALKPIGGHILSHASATRMFLRKGCFVARDESLH